MEAEPVEQIDNVGGKADAHSHVGAGILKDQIPADDPGDEFAHGGVGVGVGRAGDGNHGSEFGITEAGERTDKRDQDEGNRDGGTGAGAAVKGGVGNDVVRQRCLEPVLGFFRVPDQLIDRLAGKQLGPGLVPCAPRWHFGMIRQQDLLYRDSLVSLADQEVWRKSCRQILFW